MKYALIGCGRIAVNHIRAVINNRLELAAVCDINPDAMENILRGNGLGANNDIRRYTDYRKLLGELAPQLVGIATESGSHAQIALDCIDAGVNVIIEKPMALSIADAEEIIRRSRQKGVKVSACHQNRFNLAVMELRRAVESGRFGRLSHGTVHVRWNRGEDYYHQAPWRGTWAHDGGALMNQCIHGIDLLRWMLGDEVREVYGATNRCMKGYIEAEDVGLAVVRFQNGALGTIEGSTNVYPHNLEETLYLFGEKGTVKLGGKSVNTIEIWQFADQTEEDGTRSRIAEQTENVYGNGHTGLYADMMDAIKQNRAPYVDAVAGKNALELVLAIYKSQRDGAPVRLPLTNFASADMAGEFTPKGQE